MLAPHPRSAPRWFARRRCKTELWSGTLDPTGGQLFPNNIIPANRIANFSKGYAQYLPPANALNRLPLGVNRPANPPITSDWNQWSVRIDHNISSSDTAFYRYTSLANAGVISATGDVSVLGPSGPRGFRTCLMLEW